jgi:hypothetical protein
LSRIAKQHRARWIEEKVIRPRTQQQHQHTDTYQSTNNQQQVRRNKNKRKKKEKAWRSLGPLMGGGYYKRPSGLPVILPDFHRFFVFHCYQLLVVVVVT